MSQRTWTLPRRTQLAFHHAVLLAGLLFGIQVEAQDKQHMVQADRAGDAPITVDGRLDESAWQRAGMIEDLVQQSPHPGVATPFHTRILLLRNAHTLYIGVIADDPDPSKISTHTLVRDGDQSNDDYVGFVIDTFGTKRVAYIFQVNAAGAMADGLQAPTPAINSNNGVDYNWDGIWQAAVNRNAHGWTAEIAIDTRSLQFGNHVAAWGFNVTRNVPRELLTLNWSGTTLDSSVLNLQREGMLTGVQDMQQGQGWDFQPYGLAKQQTGAGDTSNAGFDLKYNFKPSLAGLFTYHTDFAEAEADQQQINTGRFPLFFPEKRQFFLQGSNLFSFGYNLGTNFVPYYSRTIGLVSGEPVPLNEGIKLIGQSENGSLALLDTQMAGTSAAAAVNLFAGRGTYNVDQNLQVGTLITHGNPLGLGNNTFVGTDALWKTANFSGDKNLNLSAWAAHSSGNLPVAGANGYGAGIEYPNDLWYFDAQFNQYGDALEPSLGFLPRPGTRQNYTELTYQPRPAADSVFDWVHRFWFNGHYSETDGLGAQDGGKQSSEWWYSTQMLTNGGWFWEWDVYRDFDAPVQAFDLVPNVTVLPGDYTWNRTRLVFNSPQSRSLWVQFIDSIGTYYSGTAHHPLVAAYWNLPSGKLQLNAQQEWFFFYAPQGSGATRLSTVTVTYSFTPNLYISELAQYASGVPGVSMNTRLRWIVGDASNIYLVWNRGQVNETNGLGQPVITSGSKVIFKVQWDFRD
ncbi:MAG: carbohydrate binding family 9 domain-containing protein [Gammaproteobacteria bacterium]|nr:carbohydrate binding family 9 domain-containing protein [Gammaproteobacteria bacterium]